MAAQNISNAGKIAIAPAFIAGLVALGRAAYKYSQNGELDIGEIALGIGIPCLIYTIVKISESKR